MNAIFISILQEKRLLTCNEKRRNYQTKKKKSFTKSQTKMEKSTNQRKKKQKTKQKLKFSNVFLLLYIIEILFLPSSFF
jgi:Mg2+/citrate symporter